MSLLLLVLVLFVSATGVFAEGASEADYPKQDIKAIIGSGAGGGSDAIMRKIGSIAEKSLPVTIYHVNKPGPSDATGAFEVMKAQPNGYTYGNLNYGSVVNAVFEELIPGYDLDKLEFFCLVTKEPDAIMVPADSPYKTFDDLIQAAKKNPGKIKVGDQGVGSRVYMELLRIEDKFGVEFNKVQYVKGSGPQREAILNGEIDAAITSLGDFAPLLQSGQAMGIVEFSDSENVTYPEVPTITELGHDGLLSGSFLALAVPKETPAAIVDKLEEVFRAAHETDEFRNWLASIGVSAAWLGNDEVDQFIADVQENEFKFLSKLKADGVLK